MTRPVNLYLLSRIPGEEAFNTVYHHAQDRDARHRTPRHEIQSLRVFADQMLSCGVPLKALDGFFFGYSIPQIGKEFDLLKFSEDACIVIELKSQPVPLEQVRAQLLRDRHYLGHLGRTMHLFTFVSDTQQCFQLEGDVLAPVHATDLAKAVLPFAENYLTEIDGLFRASEYLVSPANTPEKFLKGEYFLTQAQDHVRSELLAALTDAVGCVFFSLTGKPGTGKTLLLYDIGRTLGRQAKTAILCWGELAEGHQIINAASSGLTILSQDVLTEHPDSLSTGSLPILAPYSYLLVDEAHRLTPRQLDLICNSAKENLQQVVFCLDPDQVLTSQDKRNHIAGRIRALPPAASFTLSEHLRGNPQLRAFIWQVHDLSSAPKEHLDYRDVDLGYAEDPEEASRQLAYYRDRGYVFINYMKAAHESDGEGDPADAASNNPFADFEGGYDIHHVIGQEFDRVVMLLDDSFYYTEEGRLEGVPRPDPDLLYPNLFYQGITRVREKLALIVLNNEPLFDRIAGILKA